MAKNKYHTHVEPELENIISWCRDGLIESEICKRLGISLPSLANYKNKYPELCKALKEGKEIADYRVEDCLYKRATGFYYDEVTTEQITINGQNPKPATLKKTVRKYVVPDTTAQIFWLKNRKPKQWKDKQDIEIDTKNIGVVVLPGKLPVGAPVPVDEDETNQEVEE